MEIDWWYLSLHLLVGHEKPAREGLVLYRVHHHSVGALRGADSQRLRRRYDGEVKFVSLRRRLGRSGGP